MDFKGKVVFLGKEGTGKTCLFKRLSGEAFAESTTMTINAAHKNITYKLDETPVTYSLWDTAGQDKYESIARSFYRDADVILLVFSIDHRGTYDRAIELLGEIEERAINPYVIILANKADLLDKEVVGLNDRTKLATVKKKYFSKVKKETKKVVLTTSAKDSTGIDNVQKAITTELLRRSKEFVKQEAITLINEDKKEKKGCQC